MPPGLRLVDAADLHVTLLFLGNCPHGVALRTLERVAAGPPPRLAHARLGAPAAFGGRRASAYGFDLEQAATLATWLNRYRGDLLAAAGAPPEHRAARPHLSVARPRGSRSGKNALDWLATASGQRIDLAGPTLYENAPARECPRYRRLAAL